jgi:hypothetical protein
MQNCKELKKRLLAAPLAVTKQLVGFEVFTVVKIQFEVFWIVMPQCCGGIPML